MDNETAKILSAAWVLAFVFVSMVVTEIFRDVLEDMYDGPGISGIFIVLLYMVFWVVLIVGGAQWLYLKVLLPMVIKDGGR